MGFRLKHLDCNEKYFFHIARCCVHDDHQVAKVDYDPYGTYASVTCHEVVCIHLFHADASDFITERMDVSIAYLYGNIDHEVYIEEPTTLAGVEKMRGHICLLQKSMNGILGSWDNMVIITSQDMI